MIEQSGQLAAHLAALEDDENAAAKPLNLYVHVRWLVAAMFAWLTRNLRRIVPPSPPINPVNLGLKLPSPSSLTTPLFRLFMLLSAMLLLVLMLLPVPAPGSFFP